MKLHAFQQILFMQAGENLCKDLFLSEVDKGNLWLSLVMGMGCKAFSVLIRVVLVGVFITAMV
jgi:hypothetical protein